jgi:predicted transcriptional regulator
MSTKQIVLEAVSQLPEHATFERIQEEIQILARIRQGQAEIDSGRGVPHDRVRELVRQWNASNLLGDRSAFNPLASVN